jgi:hypothetical protein
MKNTTSGGQESEVRQALGYLVLEFARFETSLGCAVGYLANPRDARVGQILVAQLSFKARLTAFSTLYPERLVKPVRDDELKSFVSTAHRVEERRNALIHSFYRSGPVGDSSATRIKTTLNGQKGLKVQFEKVTAESIATEAQEASRVKGLLRKLMLKFGDYNRYLAGFYSTFKQQA